jgi:hypothetical protein
MATLIKKAQSQQTKTVNIGDRIVFNIWVPLQNIGSTTQEKIASVVKINRKTVDALDEFGNTWRVGMDEIRN